MIFKNPQTIQIEESGGTHSWVNTNYLKNPDGVNKAYHSIDKDEEADDLVCTSYDFSEIPEDVIINGITLEFTRKRSGSVKDSLVYLTVDGNQIGSNYATSELWNSNKETVVYGGDSDLWGNATITAAQVKNSTFGIHILPDNTSSNSNATAYIYSLKLKINYSTPELPYYEVTNTELFNIKYSILYPELFNITYSNEQHISSFTFMQKVELNNIYNFLITHKTEKNMYIIFNIKHKNEDPELKTKYTLFSLVHRT